MVQATARNERSNGVAKRAAMALSTSTPMTETTSMLATPMAPNWIRRDQSQQRQQQQQQQTTAKSTSTTSASLSSATSEGSSSGRQQQQRLSSSSSSTAVASTVLPQPHGKTTNNNDGSNNQQQQQQRLVFGLNERTNKHKHNEYAAERSRSRRGQESSRVHVVSVAVESTSPSSRGVNETTMVAEKANSPNSAESSSSPSSSPSTTATKTKLRVVRHRSPSGRTSRAARSEGVKKESSATGEVSNGTVIESSEGVKGAAKKTQPITSATTPKPRTQFNIPPPPPMQPSLGFGHRTSSTGGSGGSMVSYAKARIYERPSGVSSTLMRGDISRGDGGENIVDSLQMRDSIVPKSISCGFKPPKQVNVSQARAKWEGGEPFAKSKSRQRLAAQASKRLLPGTWSMTSVVATQQMQLQQALAQSSGYSKSSSASSVDQSVKFLTRGSVLERVQQFEKVPATGSPSSSSPAISPSASSDSLDTSSLSNLSTDSPLSPSSSTDSFASNASSSLSSSSTTSSIVTSSDAVEAVITIDRSKEDLRTVSSEGSLSPDTTRLNGALSTSLSDDKEELWPTSKRAQYKMKVHKLQQEQLKQWRQSESPLQQQQQQQQNSSTYNRRLSFRRRSISSVSSNSTSQSIPKFYHPTGLKPNTYKLELQRRNIAACFDKFPERCASLLADDVVARRQFHAIAVACGYSEYFKIPLQTYVRYCLECGILSNSANDQKTGTGNIIGSVKPRSVGIQRKQSTIAFNAMTNGTNVGGDQISQQKIQVKSAQTAGVGGPAAKTALGRASSIDSSTPPMPADRLRRPSIIVDKSNTVDCDQFFTCWRQLIENAHDPVAQFMRLLTLGQRDYLLPDDFVPMVQSIIDDHPGLRFLRAAPDFHMRYIQTVIARIYYCVNKSWSGRISLNELRRSNLLPVLTVLSQEDDINLVTDYFSYEHFYVIYCKFWNLDQDHDLLIGKEDLARHNDASISSRIIERIFSGAVSKQIQKTGKMTYTDFVWFLLAEEDKKHPRSIEYWFRLLDIDGDGYISIYEMEYFYYEQMKRLELMNIEALPFIDTACQLLDLVNPRDKNKISLSDLKRNKMASIFFDTFINLEKYLEHESREFVSSRDVIQDGVIVSDWERYASEEYESLVTEESSV